MKLLLTGGSGFIGSRLALAARERNLDVTVAGRIRTPEERTRARELAEAGIQLADGPLQDPEFARRVVAGRDHVIHLAAAQHEANVPDSYFEEVNVRGTQSLLEASRAAGVRRFVYGSTIGVYGSAASGRFDEGSPTGPDNAYGRSKLAAENVVRTWGPTPATSIVRISETYGGGDFRLLKLFRAIQRRTFVMIGKGRNLHQLLHVRDLICLLMLVLESPAAVGETFVAAGRESLSTREMVAIIAGVLHRPVPRLRVPLSPVAAAAAVIEDGCRLLKIQPPLHRRRLDFFRKSFTLSIDKAQSQLGFEPRVGFVEGASETAAWYREKGLLGSETSPPPTG